MSNIYSDARHIPSYQGWTTDPGRRKRVPIIGGKSEVALALPVRSPTRTLTSQP